eukprot:2259187-Rhodomonas_salina.1
MVLPPPGRSDVVSGSLCWRDLPQGDLRGGDSSAGEEGLEWHSSPPHVLPVLLESWAGKAL